MTTGKLPDRVEPPFAGLDAQAAAELERLAERLWRAGAAPSPDATWEATLAGDARATWRLVAAEAAIWAVER